MRTHGHAGPPPSVTYTAWVSMKQRCTNPNFIGAQDYSERGIGLCIRWANSFEAFLEDMGERPDGLSLERIDNDRGYEPGNCKWGTRQEQSRNRRCTVWIELDGEKRDMEDVSRRTGIPRQTLQNRLNGRSKVPLLFGRQA